MGVVEGLTEFLPVSSTGHLIIANEFMGFSTSLRAEFVTMFMVVIQLGAILAIVVLFWNKIFDTLKKIKPGDTGFIFWAKIFVAFLPAAVIGLLFNDIIDKYLFNPVTVAIALIVGGVLMILVENKCKTYTTLEIDNVSYKQAFAVGIAQLLSLWPGFSRSASTMMGGKLMGMNTYVAAEFSFFLAIPVMFAASGYSLLKDFTHISLSEWTILFVGFVVSFIVALLVVKAFMGYLKNKGLKVFAYYRIIVGIFLIGLFYLGMINTSSII